MGKKANWKAKAAKHPNPKTAKSAPGKRNKKRAPKKVSKKGLVERDRLTSTGTDGRTWYSDEERGLYLAALSANGGNVAKTAREQRVPYMTLYAWSRGWRCAEALQLCDEKRGELSDAAEQIAWQMAAYTFRDADELSPKDRVVTFGVMVDKMIDLRAQPAGGRRPEPVVVNPEVSRIAEVIGSMTDEERRAIGGLLARIRGDALPDNPALPRGGEDRGGGHVPRRVPAVLT